MEFNQKMAKISKSFIKHPYYIGILFTILFTLLSYNVIVRSDADITFHMARITGLAQSIRNFDFLPNLNFILGNGVGYGVPMFYGQWLLYPSAIIFILTKSIKISYASYAFIISLLNVLGHYYVFDRVTKNKQISLVLAMFVPIFYSNFGYGMTAASPLVPFIFLGFYEILFNNKNKSLLLGISISLLVQTHIISSIVIGLTFIIFTLINYNNLSLKKILYFFQSLILSLLLSVGFILQYLEQNKSQVFYATWTTRPFMGMDGYARSIKDILLNMFQTETTGTQIANYPSLIIIVTIMVIFMIREWKLLPSISKTLLIVYLILIAFSSNILPWNILRFTFLGVFQWTGRLLTFVPTVVLLALLFHQKRVRSRSLVTLLLITLSMYITMIVFRYNDEAKDFGDEQEVVYKNAYYGAANVKGFSGMEYLNIDISKVSREEQPPNMANYFNAFETKTKEYSITNVERQYNSLEFDISTNKKNTVVILPRIWYKGYVAEYSHGAKGSQPSLSSVNLSDKEILDNKEKRRPKTMKKVLYDGRSTIKVYNGGHVKISYQKTSVQKIGFILELILWIVTIGLGVFQILKRTSSVNT